MQRRYAVLRETSRDQRTTIADAIDILETDANFKRDDGATIRLQPLQLPSSAVVWLVSVVFDGPTEAAGFVLPMRTSKSFFAIQSGDTRKRQFEIESLDGAKTDAWGVVSLLNGNQVRAVEMMPAQLPY
jgi:hypothetical protein